MEVVQNVFAPRRKPIALAAVGILAAAGATQATAGSAADASHRATVHRADRVSGSFGPRHPRGGAAFAAIEAAKRRSATDAGPGSSPAGVSSAPSSFGVSQSTLDAIAACESGGDPTAVSADGTYRGLYQFDEGTWASVGGSGDPAAASPAEQTMRAAMLYSRSGSSPWPVCG